MRVMADLASQKPDQLVTMKDISARQSISKKYLESIMRSLHTAGLVKAVSGRSGGFCLMKSPDQISLLEILEATEGDMAPVKCLTHTAQPCSREELCPTLDLWKEYDQVTKDFFASKSLQDLL